MGLASLFEGDFVELCRILNDARTTIFETHPLGKLPFFQSAAFDESLGAKRSRLGIGRGETYAVIVLSNVANSFIIRLTTKESNEGATHDLYLTLAGSVEEGEE